MSKDKLQRIFNIITIITTVLLIAFIIYAFKLGILEDKTVLVQYMKKFGIFACLFFILIQIVQVVFPVIPGGASCLAGVLAFGPVLGFIYNYIGLALGSLIAFLLSRIYGIKMVEKLFPEETINKYLKYIQNNRFPTIFFWGIFLPGLPDDLLCYIAGLSKMSLKTFIFIILIGKPFALIFYSLFSYYLPALSD
ncbi:MAG: TVP38/TMEM64 family protein [Bacilli bacterium]|nr:TVP38/TMEM64 family protein [Bacilli bacterium]